MPAEKGRNDIMAETPHPDMISCTELVEAITAIEAWIGRVRDILEHSSEAIPLLTMPAGNGLIPWHMAGCRPPADPTQHLEGGRHEESGYELV